jgi:hypothetical protein
MCVSRCDVVCAAPRAARRLSPFSFVVDDRDFAHNHPMLYLLVVVVAVAAVLRKNIKQV